MSDAPKRPACHRQVLRRFRVSLYSLSRFVIFLGAVTMILLLLLVARAITADPLRRQAPNSSAILSFFVFGDSYTASGFNASSPPPSISQPLGYPPLSPYPDDPLDLAQLAEIPGTSANGALWAEYLTAELNTTVTLTYDFAVSGASIPENYRDQILELYEPKYSSLFTNGTASGQSWNGNSSIFASWVGINDINWCSPLFSPEPVTFEECLPPRMDIYFELMDNLYITGARNFFFVNMPPLQRAPMIFEQSPDIIANYTYAVSYFNGNLLPIYVSKFASSHPKARTIIYDAHALFTEILDHPQSYGFKDSTCYSCICADYPQCCDYDPECFWTNNYHPNTQVHERLAADMVTNLTVLGWRAF